MSASNVGDQGSIPGLGISSGEGNGNPLPVLVPGKFHGRRSLVATVHGVAKSKSWTRLSDFTFTFFSNNQINTIMSALSVIINNMHDFYFTVLHSLNTYIFKMFKIYTC